MASMQWHTSISRNRRAVFVCSMSVSRCVCVSRARCSGERERRVREKIARRLLESCLFLSMTCPFFSFALLFSRWRPSICPPFCSPLSCPLLLSSPALLSSMLSSVSFLHCDYLLYSLLPSSFLDGPCSCLDLPSLSLTATAAVVSVSLFLFYLRHDCSVCLPLLSMRLCDS